VYAPVLLAVVVALVAPLNVIVAPAPPATGLIVPEMLNVCAVPVKFTPVTLAPLIVAVWAAGLKVYPAFVAVTVYVPFGKFAKV
jgi:hypothetical protein